MPALLVTLRVPSSTALLGQPVEPLTYLAP